MQQEELQLQEEIKKLNDERQEFITKARRERMPDEEFTPQISEHYEKAAFILKDCLNNLRGTSSLLSTS